MLSTNPLIPSYNAGNQQAYKHQQNAFRHIEDSRSNKKKHKKHTNDDAANPKTGNRSFALYNQKNGRIGMLNRKFDRYSLESLFFFVCLEGVVKNRLNVATGSEDGSRILDDDDEDTGTTNKYVR